MKKYILQLLSLLILIIIMASCSNTLKTGKYVIEEVKGTGFVIKLRGVEELYNFPVNTLQVGDTVFLKRTWKQSKANIY